MNTDFRTCLVRAATLAMALAPALSASWQSSAAGYPSVVVTASDGSETAFVFSPTLTFALTDEALTVRDENVAVDVPRDVFTGFYFSEMEASVDAPALDQAEGASALMTNAGVMFRGLPAGTSVEIFGPDGKLAGTYSLDDADAVLPYDAFPQGVNIVKTPSVTFKLLVK